MSFLIQYVLLLFDNTCNTLGIVQAIVKTCTYINKYYKTMQNMDTL